MTSHFPLSLSVSAFHSISSVHTRFVASFTYPVIRIFKVNVACAWRTRAYSSATPWPAIERYAIKGTLILTFIWHIYLIGQWKHCSTTISRNLLSEQKVHSFSHLNLRVTTWFRVSHRTSEALRLWINVGITKMCFVRIEETGLIGHLKNNISGSKTSQEFTSIGWINLSTSTCADKQTDGQTNKT